MLIDLKARVMQKNNGKMDYNGNLMWAIDSIPSRVQRIMTHMSPQKSRLFAELCG